MSCLVLSSLPKKRIDETERKDDTMEFGLLRMKDLWSRGRQSLPSLQDTDSMCVVSLLLPSLLEKSSSEEDCSDSRVTWRLSCVSLTTHHAFPVESLTTSSLT